MAASEKLLPWSNPELRLYSLIIYPLHCSTLANYRKNFRASGAKDDPVCAQRILDILASHRDNPRPLRPDTVETRTMQLLVEERRKLVDQKTACTNRLTAHLKRDFPQALDWFGELGTTHCRGVPRALAELIRCTAIPSRYDPHVLHKQQQPYKLRGSG
ncbi:MAG: transposase [Acidobacteriota bacterium]